MLINKYKKKKNIKSNKTIFKKKSRIAKKIENDKDEIYALNEHDERYLYNHYFTSKTFIIYITSFKVDEIKKSRREYSNTN